VARPISSTPRRCASFCRLVEHVAWSCRRSDPLRQKQAFEPLVYSLIGEPSGIHHRCGCAAKLERAAAAPAPDQGPMAGSPRPLNQAQ
jgi:hypothetical protein